MTWSNISIVAKICPIVILALQVVSAISEKFPYESRKLELREMIAELEPLYLEMENDWRSIRNLEKSNSKIQEAIQNYDTKQAEIKRHYFKEDSLPESDKIRLEADEKTEEYFKYFEWGREMNNNTKKPNSPSTSPKPRTDFDHRNGAQTPTYRRPSAPPPPKSQK